MAIILIDFLLSIGLNRIYMWIISIFIMNKLNDIKWHLILHKNGKENKKNIPPTVVHLVMCTFFTHILSIFFRVLSFMFICFSLSISLSVVPSLTLSISLSTNENRFQTFNRINLPEKYNEICKNTFIETIMKKW